LVDVTHHNRVYWALDLKDQGVEMTSSHGGLHAFYKNIAKVIVGKKDPVIYALATLLCRGHLLLEDVPGVGKTMLARALARSVDADFKRVQFTPDLLPADITGVSLYDQRASSFRFEPGPVFTNILLTDEINRGTPRTQSALLECMAERQVSVDGKTHPMTELFMVVATQNPVEFHGTFPLPEAQLDRFFMRIDMGYPTAEEERQIVRMQNVAHPIDSLEPVLSVDDVLAMQRLVPEVRVEDSVADYIIAIVRATREHKDVELGSSPRGSLALTKAAQALALIHGRDYVSPQVVKVAAVPVLGHRMVLRHKSTLGGKAAAEVIQAVLNQVAVPVSGKS